MNQTLLRGRDIALWINRRRVTGVLSISVRESGEYRDIKEYLSDDTFRQKTSERYELTLITLPIFEGIDREPFVLSLFDTEEIRYENCIVKEKKTVYKGDRLTESTYLIVSDRKVRGGSINGRE